MGPEKIRFEREINGRKVYKTFIARLELVLLFEDGYIPTHYNTVGFANVKYQIACILKGFNKLYIGTFK